MQSFAEEFVTDIILDNDLRLCGRKTDAYGSEVVTFLSPRGVMVDVSFEDDEITAEMITDELSHVWQITPRDFRAALRKIKEIG